MSSQLKRHLIDEGTEKILSFESKLIPHLIELDSSASD
jgi:hypothetical protein